MSSPEFLGADAGRPGCQRECKSTVVLIGNQGFVNTRRKVTRCRFDAAERARPSSRRWRSGHG
ncbi:hypothetical protein ACFFX0_30740 [Citricoccus parietis]|uniref:Uncharacterized protein n=1 Tax=Citricoccus parietis TaxID=592307 RepID=A0ABV5GA30_9MICC